MIDRRLLASVGVDPAWPAARGAAFLVQRMPLRWRPPDRPRDLSTVLQSTWFAGSGECHRVLGQLLDGTAGRGLAFGAAWPYLEAAGRIASPGLPVVVGADEQEGLDGSYRRSGRAVWREAGGERRPVLALAGGQGSPGRPFDLMWFADRSRFTVRSGRLEIQDLFSVLRTGTTRAQLEGWLVRALRAEPEVIDGVEIATVDERPTIEVRRPPELVAGGRLPEPEELLAVRSEVTRAERSGDEVTVTTEDDRRLVFSVIGERGGWRANRRDGAFPYRDLALRRDDRSVALTATLDERLDPLAPGVRNQVAFDLRADLITVARPSPRPGRANDLNRAQNS